MKIMLDAFGGDYAPTEVIKGAAEAVKEYDTDIMLVGDADKIKSTAEENGVSLDKIEILHAADVIEVCDDPMSLLKEKSTSSMAVGMKALSEDKADAFVSAGSTGALTVGANFIVRRIKGCKRTALAPIMPSGDGPFMMLDAGANIEVRAEMLLQFGIMADVYMRNVHNIESPRVALLNIGAEAGKGTEVHREAYELLSASPLNFVGNFEARDVIGGGCDVLVCDGFSGNVFLKSTEGAASYMMKSIKGIFMKNLKSKLAAVMISGGLKDFKKRMDYKEYGGAVMLGCRKPVIKAHGNSDARAFKNAVRQAIFYAKTGVTDEIEQKLSPKAQ